ncbi:MAG: hypothetical protein C0514_00295 [Candidatus Puniceispirillum sp.]|nr:hypothetical protein [Candidatus Puniceispirillum sp.]
MTATHTFLRTFMLLGVFWATSTHASFDCCEDCCEPACRNVVAPLCREVVVPTCTNVVEPLCKNIVFPCFFQILVTTGKAFVWALDATGMFPSGSSPGIRVSLVPEPTSYAESVSMAMHKLSEESILRDTYRTQNVKGFQYYLATHTSFTGPTHLTYFSVPLEHTEAAWNSYPCMRRIYEYWTAGGSRYEKENAMRDFIEKNYGTATKDHLH